MEMHSVIQPQILRMVIASPSDVQSERNSLKAVAEELNGGIAAMAGLRLEIARWETDTFPGFHLQGPQGLIDSILRIPDCDILIGIFWKRFGTPTEDAKSGTEHEFRIAYEAWKQKGRPQIMVYFNQRPHTPQSRAEAEQWSQVLEFRQNFPKEGLWWPYRGKAEFERLIRSHLTEFIRQQVSLPGSLSLGRGRREGRRLSATENESHTVASAALDMLNASGPDEVPRN